MFLAVSSFGRRNELFFETDGLGPFTVRSQMSGNPVKIRDGCATVTATNSQSHCPASCVHERRREGGMRFEAGVRIPVWLCSSGSGRYRGHFSVKEKDEASLSNGFRQGLPNAFILHFAEVKAFLF
jgi:hypothetical protein